MVSSFREETMPHRLPIVTEVSYGPKRDTQFKLVRSLLVGHLIELTKEGRQKWQQQPLHSGAFKTSFDDGHGLIVVGSFGGHLAMDITVLDYKKYGTSANNRFWDDRMAELYEAVRNSKLDRSDFSKVRWSCPEEYALAKLSQA